MFSINGNPSMYGYSSLEIGSTKIAEDEIIVNNLTINGLLTYAGTTSNNNNNIIGNASVSGSLTVGGDINVSGISNFSNDVNISGLTTTANRIYSTYIYNSGRITTADFISGAIASIGDLATMKGRLYVNNNAVFKSYISVLGGTSTNSLDVSTNSILRGPVLLNSSLDVSGSTEI
jgi:hypothetical protein